MDPASLAISIASLLGVIDSCFNLYSDIKKSRERDRDVIASSIRLQVETFRLKAFQDVAGSAQSAELLKTPILGNLCEMTVEEMEKDVQAIHSLLSRHSKAIPRITDPGVNIMQVAGRASAKIKRGWHSRTWAAYDKERLNELVTRLREQNDWLMTLVPSARRQRTDFEAASSAISSDRPETLESVQAATFNQLPAISTGAEVKKMTLIAQGDIDDLEREDTSADEHQIPIGELKQIPSRWSQVTGTQSVPQTTWVHASQEEKTLAVLLSPPAGSVHDPASAVSERNVLIEWRHSFRSEDTHDQYTHRLNYLVRVLQKLSTSISQSHSTKYIVSDFDMLHCIGWTTTTKDFDRIGLVFALPSTISPVQIPKPLTQTLEYSSLNDWMVRTRKDKSLDAPALGLRFDIARGLVLALGNLMSVGWMHKELRSHNVLFFGSLQSGACPSKPFLTGYTYARPTKDTIKDISNLAPSPEYALYRPPTGSLMKIQDRVGVATVEASDHQSANDSSDSGNGGSESIGSDEEHDTQKTRVRATSALDIYGLGIILLEIGLWRTIKSLHGKSASQEHFVKHELDSLVQSLSYRMGDLYCRVVRQSLSVGDWAQDRAQEMEFFAKAIEDLSLCRA